MGETINKNRDCSKLAVGLIWKMGGERERESPWKLQKTSCGKRKFSFGGVAAKGDF